MNRTIRIILILCIVSLVSSAGLAMRLLYVESRLGALSARVRSTDSSLDRHLQEHGRTGTHGD
jgi:hypothetical protein